MNLKKIVIHEIKKEAGSKEADVEFSTRCLESDEPRRIELVSKLAESFRRSRNKVDYSDFQREKPFPQLFISYLDTATEDSDPNDEDFLDFSKRATSLLFELIQNVVPAKGGYLVFSEYILQQQQYISIFLVRDTRGNIFTMKGDVVDVGDVFYADTDKLAMACRINIGKFLTNEKTPLMMINKKTYEVSEYFATWLGANDRETSEGYTNLLHDIIIKIEPPDDPNVEGKKLSIDEVRRKVYDIVDADHDGNANLNLISKLVYGDEDKISEYLDEKHIDLPSEFKVYPSSMKKLVEVKVKDGGLKLQFSRGDFHRKVEFGENNEVVISSPAIYQELKKQLGEDEE